MVKSVGRKGKEYYQCEECGFFYADKKWAEKCEDFCKEHNACDVEIIKHAAKLK